MGEFVKVASVNDLNDSKGIVVEVKGKTLALFKQGGEFYAIDNACLHQGGPLGEGSIEGDIVSCPWHAWKYNFKTGENQFDKSLKVQTYKTKVEEKDVYVEV